MSHFFTPLRNTSPADPLPVTVARIKVNPSLGDSVSAFTGIYDGLLREIAARENWALTYQPCAFSDCMAMLARGEIDLLPDVDFLEQRDEFLDYHSVAILYNWSQVFGPRTTQLRSFEQLASQRIAITPRSSQELAFNDIMDNLDIPYTTVHVDSWGHAFEAVEQERADFALASHVFGRHYAGRFGLEESPLTFNPVAVFFAAPDGENESLLNTIDRYLLEWRDDPNSILNQSLQAIMVPPVKTVTPLWALTLMPFAIAILLALILLVSILRWTVQRRTRELEKNNIRFQHLLNDSPSIIYSLKGLNLTPHWISENIKDILGFSSDTAMNPAWWTRFLHPEDRISGLRFHDELIKKKTVSREYRVFDARGKIRYIRDSMKLIPGKTPEEDEVVGSLTDITESYEQNARLKYLTYYDPLTGLPNRDLLMERISAAIAKDGSPPAECSVLCVDFDRFKHTNESLGPVLGDRVIALLADRLNCQLHSSDTLSRINADEFRILIPRPLFDNEVEILLDNMLKYFQEPLDVSGKSLILTASIGICQCPADGESAEQLMTHSELAMFAAKQNGGNCWRRYHPELSVITEQTFRFENDLRHAVFNNELVLYYQPQFDMDKQTIVGVEALIRWEHPTEGLVSPARFIPVAEEISIIGEIGDWVMKTACQQLLEWDRQGIHIPRVGINLSVAELESDEIIHRVCHTLEQTGLAPERLELEITENMLMRVPDYAISLLEKLHRLGVQLSMDDFGTGYSNLAHLGNLPLDQLKIDQTIVSRLGHSEYNESIIQAIVALAKAMNLNIVAEGIEDVSQKNFLLQAGCPVGQGYFLGPPVTADQLAEALRQQATA